MSAFLNVVVRPPAPAPVEHHGRKEMQFDRVGLPLYFRGVCSCLWEGPWRTAEGSVFVGDMVERDLYEHKRAGA